MLLGCRRARGGKIVGNGATLGTSRCCGVSTVVCGMPATIRYRVRTNLVAYSTAKPCADVAAARTTSLAIQRLLRRLR